MMSITIPPKRYKNGEGAAEIRKHLDIQQDMDRKLATLYLIHGHSVPKDDLDALVEEYQQVIRKLDIGTH